MFKEMENFRIWGEKPAEDTSEGWREKRVPDYKRTGTRKEGQLGIASWKDAFRIANPKQGTACRFVC